MIGPTVSPSEANVRQGSGAAPVASGEARRGASRWIRLSGPAIAIALALLAGAWLFRLTARGIGVGSDSAVYFAGAEHLLDGRGFVWLGGDQLPRPINHYPPLYSVVLAAAMRLGPAPQQAARVVEVMLIAANTFLVVSLTSLLTSSKAAGLFSGLLFLASEETVKIHSWAMSDSLYLFLVLVCVTAAARYWLRGGRLDRAVMWTAASLGLLTRYVGLSLMVVPVVATLARPPRESGRWREAAGGLALAMLPGLAWLARNQALTGSPTNRILGLFPQGMSWWESLGTEMTSWFVPGRVVHLLDGVPLAAVVSAAVGVLALVAIVAMFQRGRLRHKAPEMQAAVLLLLVVLAHLAVIAASSWLTYPGPDINTRNLAPAFVGSLVLVAAAIGAVGARGSATAKAAALIAGLALIGTKAYSGRDVVAQLLRDGQGYTSRAWTRSPTVAALQQMAPDVVYANDIGAVYVLTGRFAFAIPLRYDPISKQERAAFPAEYCLMRRRLAREQGVLVYFGTPGLPEAAEPQSVTAGLQPVFRGKDGVIYADRGQPPEACLEGASSGAPSEAEEGRERTTDGQRG